jgi:hypothetical protein
MADVGDRSDPSVLRKETRERERRCPRTELQHTAHRTDWPSSILGTAQGGDGLRIAWAISFDQIAWYGCT